MAQDSKKDHEIVTAGLMVIGDEILSGRTKDRNIGHIAEYLTNIGIDLREVRVVPDIEEEIVEALNATKPYFLFRLGGGLVVLSGMLVMGWNVLRTFQLSAASTAPQPVLPPDAADARA